MAKITLSDITGNYGSQQLHNANSDAIEAEFNDKVLYRDNPEGEPNQMENNLDMNSNRIINLPDAEQGNEPATLDQLNAIVAGSNTSAYATVADMLTDADNVVGQVYSAGGTSWRVDTATEPMVIENYTALNEVNIAAFGALEDGSSVSAACQAAIDYAAPRNYPVRIMGDYYWDTTVNVRSDTILYCDGSTNNVATGIGDLFYADARTATLDKVTITGGEWIEDYATTPNVTFYRAEGAYNAGSPIYVWRTNLDRVRVSGFNWFVEGDFHRSWNMNNCFAYVRNGIRMGSKNVEVSIHQCIVFGRDFNSSDTRGFILGEGVTQTSMYVEGIKVSKCTIDGFGRNFSIYSILDCNITDNWISCPLNNTDHCMYIAADGVNNLYKGININNNTFKRGKIEFVTQTAPPSVLNMQLADNLYIDAQQITIGNYWHNMTFANWDIERIGDSSGTGIGFLLNFDNKKIKFDSIQFRRDWVRLVSILGANSEECLINNVWSDDFMDRPFYYETPTRVFNSSAGDTPSDTISHSGQIIFAGELLAATVGNDAFVSPTLSFKEGSLIQVEIHGEVTNTVAGGRLEFSSSTAGTVESVTQGAGFTGRLVELQGTTQRVDAIHIWRVIDNADTTITVTAETGDLTVTGEAFVVIRYL